MVLTYREYQTFKNLFFNVASWEVKNKNENSEPIIVTSIKLNKFASMGKLLYMLLQQNILKEFLIEKVYYDESQNNPIPEMVPSSSNTQTYVTTFSWRKANNGGRTNIINWDELLNTTSLDEAYGEYPEVTNRVERGIY